MASVENRAARPSRRDAFAEAKDAFIMSVVRDRTKKASAVKLAVTMAIRFANRKHFEETRELVAWPSQRKLSEETEMFRSQIDRAARALETSGHFVVQRSEKRGSNRYVMCVADGRTHAATEGRDSGRTNCATSLAEDGRSGAAIVEGGAAACVRPLVAAPVRPNSYEEPLDDADAHSRPLSDSADPLDPDAWRNLPQYGGAGEVRGAPEGAPAAQHQDEDDGGGFERSIETGANELRRLFPELHTDLRRFMEDVADGLCARDPEALIRLKGCAELMVDPIPLSLRREKLDRLSSVMIAVAAFGGGTAFANRVVSDFLRPYQENCEGVCHE